MMKKRITSFGYLQPLLFDSTGKKLLAELAYFSGNGKSHTHDEYENCFVHSGKGRIVIIENPHQFKISAQPTIHNVKKGDFISIRSGCPHWMEVDGKNTMKILLVYSPVPISPAKEYFNTKEFLKKYNTFQKKPGQ